MLPVSLASFKWTMFGKSMNLLHVPPQIVIVADSIAADAARYTAARTAVGLAYLYDWIAVLRIFEL